jgi:hypothetical protein
MGMFDELQLERPLPDGTRPQGVQTKSLACTLSSYTLSAAGRLLGAGGSDTGYHGVMRFHCVGSDGRLREYEAKFTDGQLQHLVPLAQALYDEAGLRLQAAAADPQPPT